MYKLNHCAVRWKLTQHCKSIILQLKKKKKKILCWFDFSQVPGVLIEYMLNNSLWKKKLG